MGSSAPALPEGNTLKLLEKISQPIVLLDRSGSISFANEPARRLFGGETALEEGAGTGGFIRVAAERFDLSSSERLRMAKALDGGADFRLTVRGASEGIGLSCSQLSKSIRMVEIAAPGGDPSRALLLEQEAAIRTEHSLMFEMLDHMEQGVVLYDRNEQDEEVVRFFNSKAESLLELPAGFLKPGVTRRDIIAFCDARGDHSRSFELESYIAKAEDGQQVRVLSQRPSGKYVINMSHPRRDRPGSLTLYVDVSQNVSYQRRLKDGRAEYRALAETAPTGILRVDRQGRVAFANLAARNLFEVEDGAIDLMGTVYPVDGKTIGELLGSGNRFEADLRFEKRIVAVYVSTSSWIADAEDAEDAKCIVTLTDISSLKKARTQIEHMALHDQLTGLGNRLRFTQAWQTMTSNPDKEVFLLALDLDHFKSVNDTYGHGVGDALLTRASTRLREALPDGCEAFRLGGDEFAVLIRDRTGQEAETIARKVTQRLCEDFLLDGTKLTVGCSAGLAAFPRDGASGEDVQRAADIALYRVKRTGRNGFAVFDPALEDEALEQRRLESDLAKAVARGEFRLVYQPQIDMQSERVIGMEALLRWHNKRLDRDVPPSVFIPIAESCGLISLIDLWVLREAVKQARGFLDGGCERPFMAINLSPISLYGPEIVDHLRQALADHGVPADLIEIEVTEGVAIVERERLARTLSAIQALGSHVAIDDFGAGHTSLTYIQTLPINRVKIDRSLIANVNRDDSTRAIVASIKDLCGRLGLRLTAEGVETADQWDQLRSIGMLDGQGYYFSHPEPASILMERFGSARLLTAIQDPVAAAG